MKIVLYIVWMLFVAGVIWALGRSYRKSREKERLIATWPKTLATVTGSRAGWTSGVGNSSRNRRFWPRYEFRDPRGVVYLGESEVSLANEPLPGSPLQVAYNPEDPNQSFQPVKESRLLIGCLAPVFGLLALGSFWFIGVFPLG